MMGEIFTARVVVLAFIFSLVVPASAQAARVQDPHGREHTAKNALAAKLLRLGMSLDMRERSYPDSAGSGKSFDNDSGNSFLSNTTIHYRVQSTCMKWISNPTSCDRWLDPFIAEHGFGADFSPLEGAVAEAWQQHEQIDGEGAYKIWDIKRHDGSANTHYDGRFNKSGISQWALNTQVERQIAQVGRDTATRQMLSTFEKEERKDKNFMPNMESLRMMGSRWTKMMRNKLVDNLGKMRASRDGVDYVLDEELPDCEAYFAAAEAQSRDNNFLQKKLTVQAQLRPTTQAKSLESRYDACVALRNASVREVNPQQAEGKTQAGDPESEPADEALTRLNIAAIDQGGVDIQSLARPSTVELTAKQITSEIADFEAGGMTIRGMKRQTNARTLEEYNRNLEWAAVGYKEVAMYTRNIADKGDQVRKFKIAPGSKNLVELNGLTPEMRNELKGTEFEKTVEMQAEQNKGPANQLEDIPVELTVTKR